VDGSDERGVFWVDGFERGGHVELNFDAIAVFPCALEAEEFAGGGQKQAVVEFSMTALRPLILMRVLKADHSGMRK